MRHVGATVTGALGIAFAFAMACGPDVGDKAEQVAHRVAPCKTWCEGLYDSECGRTENTATDHKTADECIESCTDPEEAGFNWARNDEGQDVCKAEWTALAECLPTLTCGDAREFWNADRTTDYPCKEADLAQALCYSEWAIAEGE